MFLYIKNYYLCKTLSFIKNEFIEFKDYSKQEYCSKVAELYQDVLFLLCNLLKVNDEK